jgi:hypothetical protein
MGIMGVEPWMTQRRPKKRATNYAAVDAGSFGVTPKATADWQTIDAASLAPNPQNAGSGDFSNLNTPQEDVSPTSTFKDLGDNTDLGNQFEDYTGGDTSIDTFGTSAADDLYYNLVNALSGNQYNRELIGQDLAFGLDTADRNRDRAFRGLENSLNSRGMWDSGVMNRDVGECCVLLICRPRIWVLMILVRSRIIIVVLILMLWLMLCVWLVSQQILKIRMRCGRRLLSRYEIQGVLDCG